MGKYITEHLLKTGKHVVTAITRPGSTNTLPEGVRVARVDYSGDGDDDGAAALVDALRGQQALIITMATTAPKDSMLKLVRAAAAAGVPYVLPNWFGPDTADDTLCDEALLREMRDGPCAEIRRLGVSAYVMLVCGFWYEFSLAGAPDRYGFDLEKRSLVLLDGGDVPINTTTWPQCGRAVARLLSLKVLPDDEADRAPTLSAFRNGAIYVSSFRISQRDMWASVRRVTGTAETDWTVTHESSSQRWRDGVAALRQGDRMAFVRVLYSRVFFPNGGGDYQSKHGLHNDLLGLPVEDLDEFTRMAIRMAERGELSGYHASKVSVPA